MKAINVKCRIVERINNSMLMIIVFIIVSVYSCTADAQSHIRWERYIGFEGTFGVRSFTIKSDVPEVNHLQVVEEGGSAGIVIGNNVFKASARILGFYYSISSVPRTIDLFESEMVVQYYPLQRLLRSSGMKVYVSSGVSMDKIKFYGHYLKQDEPINYSDIREPYLGKLSQLNASVGIGFEYRLPNVDFVHLFAEGRYGIPIQSTSSTKAFANTTIKNFTSISVGVSFGRKQ
jgi:hypothetical protein